jgi:hypothetical protein
MNSSVILLVGSILLSVLRKCVRVLPSNGRCSQSHYSVLARGHCLAKGVHVTIFHSHDSGSHPSAVILLGCVR